MYDELIARLKNRRICIQQSGSLEDFPLLKQAAEAIEQLSNAGSAYGKAWTLGYDAGRSENMPRWIPVTEQLPEKPGTYLVVVKEPKKWAERRAKGEAEEWENFDFSHVEPAFYNNDQSVWDDDDVPMNANLDVVNTHEAFHVTHWQPLPEPPEEET